MQAKSFIKNESIFMQLLKICEVKNNTFDNCITSVRISDDHFLTLNLSIKK